MGKYQNIFSVETIHNMAADLKGQGKKIGLTHGAFDLFHMSHLDLLKKSSTTCDFLIVGVDSDENIAQYKTYKRPIVDQESRLKIISELSCVDAVFVNRTPLNVEAYIQLYQYFFADIVPVGRKVAFKENINQQATKAGAQMITIDTIQNHSTTRIVNKIVERYTTETTS